MPDVLQKIISGNNFKNGTAVVSIQSLGVVTNHTLDPRINVTDKILIQSGIYDSRLDDVRYYSGDTSA